MDDTIPESLIGKIDDISLKPQNPIYLATEAANINGDVYLRDSCTEYKIINDIAAQLGMNHSVIGNIKLFTEKEPCVSCQRIFEQFSKDFPNIKIDIIHNNGNMIKP